jgi:hypothetical protein
VVQVLYFLQAGVTASSMLSVSLSHARYPG